MSNFESQIKELELRIAEVKKRFPYHSVQPYLIQELEELEEQLDELLKGANDLSGEDYKGIIEKFICDYPICEFYHIDLKDLVFSDKVRYICENACDRYNKSWACPPAINSIDHCMKECETYTHVFLFTSVAEVPDRMDFSACLEARRDHERMTFDLRQRFESYFGNVLALSSGCMICGECAYPVAPCRYPEDRMSSIESHGILILETASRLGITLDWGNNVVVYVSMIFFNA